MAVNYVLNKPAVFFYYPKIEVAHFSMDRGVFLLLLSMMLLHPVGRTAIFCVVVQLAC